MHSSESKGRKISPRPAQMLTESIPKLHACESLEAAACLPAKAFNFLAWQISTEGGLSIKHRAFP